MLPHDNNTISFSSGMLNSGRKIGASLVDGTLAETLAWETVCSELPGENGKLVAERCWQVVLEIVGVANRSVP